MTDHLDEWDPREDPFACSRCGDYLASVDRIEGREYCDGCRREFEPECYRGGRRD